MLSIYFGVPGSGKTTHAASVVLRNLQRGVTTYSNVDIKGAVLFSVDQLGVIDISDGDMIIDEASIELNNRAYKSLPQNTIRWLKLYRHYGIRNIYVYSQSYDDMDITLRRLADRLYIVRRSAFPYVHYVKPIYLRIGVDGDTHQIVQQYFMRRLFGNGYFFAPRYWCMFDSWAAPALPGGNLRRVSCDLPVVCDKSFLRAYASTLRPHPISYALRHIRAAIAQAIATAQTSFVQPLGAGLCFFRAWFVRVFLRH